MYKLDASLGLKAWFLFFLLIFLSLTLVPINPSYASAVISVNNFTDEKRSNDGQCTLREAVIAANTDKRSGGRQGECVAGNGADVIQLPPGTYILTRTDNGREDSANTGDLDITEDLIIEVVADAQGNAGATVDGSALSDRLVHVVSGNVALSNLTLVNGSAPHDGGGGLFNAGTLTAVNLTLSGNASAEAGGGFANSGTASLNNVTITANAAGTGSGGVHNSGTLFVQNSLIVANAGADCSGTLTSQGHNLVEDTTGCTLAGDATGNLVGLAAQLDVLADNGGGALTHALLLDSPAIEAGNNATCAVTDARGVARPQGFTCDIGAFELENPPQTGPTRVVNTADDVDDGLCDFGHCSLREAINSANANPDTTTIIFDIPGGNAILLDAALPALTAPALVDGTSQPEGSVAISPASDATGSFDGLTITAGDSTVTGLEISGFGGNGITILGGTNNRITQNNIHDNGGLSLDLDGDGRSDNDTNDGDTGANFVQNFPVLIRAVPDETAGTLAVTGRLNSRPNTTYTLEFFAGAGCSLFGGGEQTFLGTTQVTTDGTGDVYFTAEGLTAVPNNYAVNATATDPSGNTSEYSGCVTVGPGNDAWPHALRLNVPTDFSPVAVEQLLDLPGQSRWYKFTVHPGSRLVVTLTDLPANYDLTVYKDIAQAFKDLQDPEDLALLDAEFAPDAFSPDAFSPDAFSPDAFSPDAFSPDAFSPDAFSPDAFSPDAFSPDAFSPDAFSPDAFSPDAFSPDAFSPDAFSPDAFSPDAFSPDAFSPDAFSSAQTRSLLSVSAFPGTAGEGVVVNTWNNTGDFYVRVRGANGAFNAQFPYHLEIRASSLNCETVEPPTSENLHTAVAGNYKTLIITDPARMEGTPAEKAALEAKLAAFADPVAHPEVAGVVLDLGDGTFQRVADANAQADANLLCPYAKNIVADEIKAVVDAYWELNPLEYILFVGGDGVIPLYRYPDNAMLANEQNFFPPVANNTASQAALRNGYYLGQDAYGARTEVSFKTSTLPIPELAVGRLVETAGEVNNMLDAYELTDNGTVSLTTPPLATGYDFMTDAAFAIETELEAVTGLAADTLIADPELPPGATDPADLYPTNPNGIWSADHLREQLLGSRHDLTFLAGHFSASSALAADYTTRILAEEVMASSVDLRNAIIFAQGCHAAYNIVNADGTAATREPDFPRAFNYKGATLIGGTGYQYGETILIEYGERLYLNFSQELSGSDGPITVGQALVNAKNRYLAETGQMRGIHEKTLQQVAIFGFPMLSVDVSGNPKSAPPPNASVGSPTPVGTNPGQDLGLSFADVTVTPDLTPHEVVLTNVEDPNTEVTGFYMSGGGGTLANPAEPMLPLEFVDATVANQALRGVVFLGGSYTDRNDTLALTGAPTTEIRGVHAPFLTNVFYPVTLWQANYFDLLADPTDGATRLAVIAAHFRSADLGAPTGTYRSYNSMAFRLYYSANTAAFAGGSVPALAGPPTVVAVTDEVDAVNDQVNFGIDIVSNPAAGVQEAWVLYTATSGPFYGQWQPLSLTRSSANSVRWEGSLDLQGTDPGDVRYIVQAVNGVGKTGMATNLGAYYTPGSLPSGPQQPTNLALALTSSTSSAPYGTQAEFKATLTSNGAPVEGEPITFGLGSLSRQALTDANGEALVSLSLLALPGDYDVRASFAGAAGLAPSAATLPFEVTKLDTTLSLDQPAEAFPDEDVILTATLTDAAGRPLNEKTVIFVISGAEQALSEAVITNHTGQAILGNLDALGAGAYTVDIYFGGNIPLHTSEIVTYDDPRYNPSTDSGTLTLLPDNLPPSCDAATASVDAIWPANKELHPVNIAGVNDPDSVLVNVTITSIFQDERVGRNPNSSPDGFGIGTDTAEVRAERDGNGDGRVYHISFTADDGEGGTCAGTVRVPIVPHDQSGEIDNIDDGPLYDSTVPG